MVNTIKNINTIENPNILTWYKVTAIGNNSNIKSLYLILKNNSFINYTATQDTKPVLNRYY